MKVRFEIQRRLKELPNVFVTVWSGDHKPNFDDWREIVEKDNQNDVKYRIIQVDFQGE